MFLLPQRWCTFYTNWRLRNITITHLTVRSRTTELITFTCRIAYLYVHHSHHQVRSTIVRRMTISSWVSKMAFSPHPSYTPTPRGGDMPQAVSNSSPVPPVIRSNDSIVIMLTRVFVFNRWRARRKYIYVCLLYLWWAFGILMGNCDA